jgi:L-fuculose-phosphate aldolase
MTRSLRLWRERVTETAREMAARGLVRGSSGNVSVRVGDTVLITPTRIPYAYLRARQVVAIDLAGKALSGSGGPSSEWRLHVAIYRARADVRAIVHTHSPYATAVAVPLPELPVAHDEGELLFGRAIPVARHAPPGTWDLAHAAVAALGGGNAVLLARHGAVAVGSTLRQALDLAEKLEETAQLFSFRFPD